MLRHCKCFINFKEPFKYFSILDVLFVETVTERGLSKKYEAAIVCKENYKAIFICSTLQNSSINVHLTINPL